MQARHLLFQAFFIFYLNVEKATLLFLLAAQFLPLPGVAGANLCVRPVTPGRHAGLPLHGPASEKGDFFEKFYRKGSCTDLYLALRSIRQRVLFLDGTVMASVPGETENTFCLSPVRE
ncbi:hypothetical protein VU01_14082 [Candidatus Electrothrix marina]|uniref:Uncharacterized protein n=1 Tax=Candidatus Electrothrix marina TaxID=1859130 RepID=A0A444JAC7_9BACT|nr:hypothetical protein VU01_14082 [Candidatus Electrothrix marina]